MGVSIQTVQLVWENGPYRTGKYPDLIIFMKQLLQRLDETERVVADNGYHHASCVTADI